MVEFIEERHGMLQIMLCILCPVYPAILQHQVRQVEFVTDFFQGGHSLEIELPCRINITLKHKHKK